MKSKFIPRTIFSGITVTTILLIALIFMLFFFVSVQNKEQQIIERGFRVLNHYANNMDSRFSNFSAMAKNEKAKQLVLNPNYKSVPISIDSIMGNPEAIYNNKQWIKHVQNDVTMVVSAKQWVKNLFSDEVFNDYIIIRNKEVCYKTFKHNFTLKQFDDFVKKALIENNSNKSIFNKATDSSLNIGEYFESGFISDISLSHTQYKLFILPVLASENNADTLYLGGLIKNSEFNKTKRATDSWLVIFIILIFTAVIISLPIIKLFLLNTIERIKAVQLYYAGAAIIFGFAILNIIFLNRLTSNFLVTQSKNQVQILNKKIRKSLTKEIEFAYNTLKTFDSTTTFTDTVSCLLADKNFNVLNNRKALYPFFRTSFWMNKNGQQLMELSTWNDPASLINLKHRNYFKKHDEWILPHDQTNTKKIRLESIYSNTKGIALVALSMPSEKANIVSKEIDREAKVAALTAPMYSLIETILPKGFEFRIIDENGVVWFHNNKDKNLQENIFEETNNNRKLQASIESRVKNHLTLPVYGSKYYAYICPISNIPLYLVTLENKNANAHQNAQITVALLLFMSFILVAGILFVIFLTIVNLNRSSLHHRRFVLSWLFPSKKGDDKIEYSFLLFINVLQIIGLIIVVFFVQTGSFFSTKSALLLCFSLFLFNTILPYYILKVARPKNIELIKYKSKYQEIVHKLRQCKRFFKDKNNSPLLISLTIIAIGYSIIGIIYKMSYALIGIGLVLAVFVSAIAFRYLTNKNNKHSLFDRLHAINNSNYIAYKRYMLSWLILLSFLIPTFFYKMLFIETSQIKLKHQQVHIARQYEKRSRSIDKHYGSNILRTDAENDSLLLVVKELKKEKGIYSSIYWDSNISKKTKECVGKVPNWFTTFFHSIDGVLGNKGMFPPDFNSPRSADSLWKWQVVNRESGKELLSKNLKFYYQASSKYLDTNKFEAICVESKLPSASPLLFKTNWQVKTDLKKSPLRFFILYILTVGITLLFAGFLIKKLLSRLFPYHYQNLSPNLNLHDAIIKYFSDEKGNIIHPSFDMVFVNSLGFDLLVKEIKEQYAYEEFSKYGSFLKDTGDKKLAFTTLPNTSSELKEHIEQINRFRKKSNIPLVMLSNKTPNQLIKQYLEAPTQELENEFKQVLSILKSFFATTITCFIDEKLKSIHSSNTNNKYALELYNSQFLIDLKNKLFEANEDEKDNLLNDEEILEIQYAATNYYRNLWNNCTAEEQFILFDLSTDSVTNTNNREELEALIHKRLIKTNNGLEIMNLSFANFIIEYTKTDKLKYMEFEAKRKSGWGQFRIPLILVGLAIFAFIVITQQGLVSNLYAILISVGGIISVASKYSSLFKTKSN